MAKFLHWIPAIAMMLIIYFLSSLTGNTIEGTLLAEPIVNFNGHFVLFFLLGGAYYLAMKKYAYAGIFGMAYALSDEFHQRFVPGRSWQIRDLIVDGTGIVLALLLIWIVKNIQLNKQKNLLEN